MASPSRRWVRASCAPRRPASPSRRSSSRASAAWDEHAPDRGAPRLGRGATSAGGCEGPCRGPPPGQMSKVPIARDGWPFIAIPGVIALGLTVLGHRRLAVPFAAAAAASTGFFRDPERASPAVANGVLSPADGRVMSIEDVLDPFVGPSVRVAIFLSPLD